MPSVADLESQPLEAPLNPKALLALRALQDKHKSDNEFLRKLQGANKALLEATDGLGQRAQAEKEKREKRLERLEKDGNEEDPEQKQTYDTFQAKVEELTKRMDMSVRQLVDNRIWLEELPNGLKHVVSKAGAQSQSTQTQRSTQRSTQLPTQDRSPRRRRVDDEEEEEEHVGEDPIGPPQYEETPIALLRAAFSTQAAKWDAKTLTEKYAHDNDYAGFYRTKHDAKYPADNAPPVLPPAIWFAAEEGNAAALSQDPNSDGEIQAVTENISIKCPLTLQPFTEAVTSEVCKHSYDKPAILEFLRTSADHLPFSQEINDQIATYRGAARDRYIAGLPKTPRVQCPSCNKHLVETDLKPNPALQRRTKRVLEEQKRREEEAEDEDSEEEDDVLRGTQRRPMGLGSSPMTSNRVKAERVKRERMSQGALKSTQTVVDVDDDEDEDDLMSDG